MILITSVTAISLRYLVRPFVFSMKIIKDETAKTEADIPPEIVVVEEMDEMIKEAEIKTEATDPEAVKKVKVVEEKSEAESENKEGESEKEVKEGEGEKEVKEVKEGEEEEKIEKEPEEIYDLTGCKIQFTTISLLGKNIEKTLDATDFFSSTNPEGTSNLKTEDGDELFIFEVGEIDF